MGVPKKLKKNLVSLNVKIVFCCSSIHRIQYISLFLQHAEEQNHFLKVVFWSKPVRTQHLCSVVGLKGGNS